MKCSQDMPETTSHRSLRMTPVCRTFLHQIDRSPQLQDGLTAKALVGNFCVNCCTWSVSWSPARSTCLNPSHPNLICTLTPYTSWMDPAWMTPPTVLAKRNLKSWPPKVTGKSHSPGRVTSNLPSGLRLYDCTPFGRRPRGKLFFSRMSYAVAAASAVKFAEVVAAVAYAT